MGKANALNRMVKDCFLDYKQCDQIFCKVLRKRSIIKLEVLKEKERCTTVFSLISNLKDMPFSLVMVQKYVIYGAPGSGKTTIMIGRGSEDPETIKHDCLQKREIHIVTDTLSKVIDSMIREGISPMSNREELLRRMLVMEQHRYGMNGTDNDELCFFERGLPGYEVLATQFGLQIPSSARELLMEIRYASPVFILEPISNFDISQPRNGGYEERVFTLAERRLIHAGLESGYQKHGYSVVEVEEETHGGDPVTVRLDKILGIVNK